MKQRLVLVATFIFGIALVQHINAKTIEWGDFTGIAVPVDGSVSSPNRGLSFEVNFVGWSSSAPNLTFGAGNTTNNLLDWQESSLLRGNGRTNYRLNFENITSHDDSLYFSAVWLLSGRPITITAFDVTGGIVDLSSTVFVDTFFGSGPTTWNGATGRLTMFGGDFSEHGGIVDLSGLGIDQINVQYSTVSTQDGFSIGLAVNAVPLPASVWLFISSLLGLWGITRNRVNLK